MVILRHLPLLLLTACATAPSAPATPAASASPRIANPLTFARVFADPPLEGRAPTSLSLSPDGALLTWLQANEADSEVLDLYARRLPEGASELLVATKDLLQGASQKLTEQEKMALERKRITKRGITSYQWCGKASDALIFPFSGDLYYARLGAAAPVVTRLTQDDEVPEINPRCSPDGKKIAFVKGADVVALDVATGASTPVTRGGGGTRSFGLAEFVAEEEMGRHDGFWWAPDGARLIVFEVDEAPVGVKRRAQIHADHTAIVDQRYPAAGEPNANVTAWLYPLGKGKPVAISVPAEDGYLPRAGFFPDNTPWVQWQSRDQKTLLVLEVGPDGKTRELVRETDPTWVELHDDLKPLEGTRRFLWSTERSGMRQLVTIDRDTLAVVAITNEPEPVAAVHAIEQVGAGHRVFFTAFRDRGREQHVFAVLDGAVEQLTIERGWHSATFAPSGRFFIDRYSDLFRPTRTTLNDTSGKVVHVIDANPATELTGFETSKAIWMDIESEGQVLNGLLLEPAGRVEGRRYPVIAYVYGGPASQTVRRAWQRTWLPLMVWTHMGYGVFLLDNRGMGGRDRAFGRGHHHQMGEVEVVDQKRGVEALSKVEWVDGARIGIFGWSYGGYLAARAVLEEGSPWAAAAAVAPVTDWTLYDTHYTERYLGVPERKDGALVEGSTYWRGDLVRRAPLLSRPLLLVHGTADDNVLFDNTLKLTEALQNQGKAFDLMIYPGKAHGISGRAAQRHVWETLTRFFDRHLAP
jgi:dipeptidyl-peptidase-4